MIDCDRYPLQQGRFRKVKFFSKIMHTISNIIFQVTSYMDGDFNIIHGNEKNPILESSYKAMN